MSSLERDKLAHSESVLMASEIDLVDVGLRTGGSVRKTDNKVQVLWADGYKSLLWEDPYPPISTERTLKLWRGEWGGGGMEACGLVMGEDFVAFVYPNQEPIIEAEIISKDGIKYIKGSEGIFNPAFTSARNLAREKLRQSAQAAT